MASRTMVYLEPEQLDALRRRARVERVPVTELVRRLVRQYLAEPAPKAAPESLYGRLVGIGASGRDDVSQRHDLALGEALAREHLR